MNLWPLLTENTVPGEVLIDDTWYSPGVIGFIATFGVAAAAVLLIFDLVRRIRRVRYRAEISEKLDMEQLEQEISYGSPDINTRPDRPAPPEKPQR